MVPSASSTDLDAINAAEGRLGRTFARLIGLIARPDMAKWRPIALLAVLITLAAKSMAVISPVFFGDALNALEAGAAFWGPVALGLLAYAGARFLANGLPQLRDAIFADVSQDVQRALAIDAFANAQTLSLQFHQTRRAGALNRIIERGAAAIDFLLSSLVFNVAPTFLELGLAATVLTARYGPAFAVIAVVTVFSYFAFTVLVTEVRVRQRRAMNEADAEVAAISIDSLTNFETVKAFGAERRETARLDGAMRQYNRLLVKALRSLAALNSGQELIMTSGQLAMAGLAAWRASRGEGGYGDVAAVTLMMVNIHRPLSILGWAWRQVKQSAVDLEKLEGLLRMQSDVVDRPGARALAVSGGSVSFDGVSFVHAGREGGLHGVNLEAPAGGFIGLVGPSGAGKSTILKLLFRFYEPDAGIIRVDGHDIAELTQESLRAAIGVVPQDVVLFNNTLAFNIGYGRPEASEAEIMDAVRQAQLGAFVDSLPEGLQTRVGERGLKLSGGERQRVGLARVLLKNPAILILDEATSSLDSDTEREVQTALARAAEGRTTIAVAHRLSTLAKADRIYVLDAGQIVESGHHDALLERDGLYARLWRVQSDASGARSGAPA
ncbi:MAG: ABCB family ABC transporter ATP-binding protein/permease [Maricaulaceae bacterium]